MGLFRFRMHNPNAFIHIQILRGRNVELDELWNPFHTKCNDCTGNRAQPEVGYRNYFLHSAGTPGDACWPPAGGAAPGPPNMVGVVPPGALDQAMIASQRSPVSRESKTKKQIGNENGKRSPFPFRISI
jgi:hypothetical protein